MAYNFLPAERDQLYLMPPSLRDWLPEDHLALFVLDVVDELDLSGLYERYRPDGLGRAAYEPSVMVAILLYAYCIGERSSRRIERRCVEDIAFRVLAANQVPDHATIARFVKNNERALSALFCQVLVLSQEAGLVKLGVVALDGTKIAASASGQANRTRGDLEAEASRILAEAIATDSEEDARHGTHRGDELPGDRCDPRSRRTRIAQAKARLDAEDARRQAEYQDRLAAKAIGHARPEAAVDRSSPGEPSPSPGPTSPTPTAPSCMTRAATSRATTPRPRSPRPDHRGCRGHPGGLGQPPARAHAPSLSQNLSTVGLDEAIGAVVADAGYWSQGSAALDGGPELFIATKTDRKPARPPLARTGRISASATPLQLMKRKLGTKRGRAIYARRAITAEPVFGQIKEVRGARRFQRRGLSAVDCEWKLLAMTHNLMKMWRMAAVIGSPT